MIYFHKSKFQVNDLYSCLKPILGTWLTYVIIERYFSVLYLCMRMKRICELDTRVEQYLCSCTESYFGKNQRITRYIE